MSDDKELSVTDLTAAILRILHGEYAGTIKIEITATPIKPVVQGTIQEIQT